MLQLVRPTLECSGVRTIERAYLVRYARQAVRTNPRMATVTAKVTSHPVTNLQAEASDKAIDSEVSTVAVLTPIQNSQSRDQLSSIHEFPAMREDCPEGFNFRHGLWVGVGSLCMNVQAAQPAK